MIFSRVIPILFIMTMIGIYLNFFTGCKANAKQKPQPHDMYCINLNHNSNTINILTRCENSEVICHVSRDYRSGGISCFKKKSKL